jgi:nitrite reductase/ring-hydroxylating ferredoxin subunit
MTQHKIGTLEDLPQGESLGVEVGGLEIAAFNVDGELYALQNKCIHKQGPMSEAEINENKETVCCPWHYWEFELDSGEFVVDRDKGLRTFDVEVDGDDILVDI